MYDVLEAVVYIYDQTYYFTVKYIDNIWCGIYLSNGFFGKQQHNLTNPLIFVGIQI